MLVFNQFRKFVITGALCLISVLNAQAQNKAYIEKYKPLCDSLSAEFGIPSNVILGIAMHESGNGTSRVCRLIHNHFGIVGKNNLRQTHNIKSRYKAYENDTESFLHFCQYVSARKYYQKLKGSTSLNKWLYSIGRAGYCAHPKLWSRMIINILKKSNLL
jgi:flagellum-specific peptidoglycan hydrolase FlgJ